MFTYQTIPVQVQAWQNTAANRAAFESDDTTALPGFFLANIAINTIRVLPDHSLHIVNAEGQTIPLPENYWLIQTPMGLSTAAPDIFPTIYQGPVEAID